VNSAVPTNLFIVDAVQTMVKAQEYRHGGCPAELGLMISGVDPVSRLLRLGYTAESGT